jgi:(1->4)-alpha-D-glucan 1-alpha-D-glucosylmutase
MSVPEIPTATYRLQFNRSFTFAQATQLVPYLAQMGISHCYASPYLRARPGSMHGYDIIDHNQLNPEIGTAEEFEQFVEALHQHGMGQILDIVPNHMGVMGADNAWWLDVLENGEASDYSAFFDIDWQPIKDELQGKVLVPVLDDQYGTVLDRGDLQLKFDAEKGEFSVFFYQHRFPIDPKEYPRILGRQNEPFGQTLTPANSEVLELQSLISAFSHLPGRASSSPEQKAERNRDKEIHKRRLAALCLMSVPIAQFIEENVRAINGTPGDTPSFDELHELIKAQAFRLAYWRVAADDINYRRFFDINDLAGLCMENPLVFEATHHLIMDFVRTGKVNGLRIDHPDGLFDPAQYFERIQAAHPSYVVVEKILGEDEPLPLEWPVQGTTGYDFSNLVNGLFVDTSSAAKMVRGYRGFLGREIEFHDVLYASKKRVMHNSLASELNVLANILGRLALSNRHTCDFTLNSLRDALSDVVANFPVYRTYLTSGEVSAKDRRYIETALRAAERQSTSQDTSVYGFLRQVLLTRKSSQSENYRDDFITFAMKFQQFTSPVMAKGLEDTSFYRYHPLISLNDVGGSPNKFGVTPREFHAKTVARARGWPHSMLATSTHDSKLSEDVRARIDVLSEIPAQWRLKARQWRLMNFGKKRFLDGVEAPTRNDEYLFYQVMLGAWPLREDATGHDSPEKGEPSDELRERFKRYMLKASREAKESTSWANQNLDYENALNSFVHEVLGPASGEFLSDFAAFQRRIACAGAFNSLSQALVKFTSPGVPDLYQGNELWEFRMVDPDNRRPVDYQFRQKLLREFTSLQSCEYRNIARSLFAKVQNLQDVEGRAKLFVTWRALHALQEQRAIFQDGDYIPLTVDGTKSDHVVAYARKGVNAHAMVAVPRMCFRMLEGGLSPAHPEFWQDTRIHLPEGLNAAQYRNWMTGEIVRPDESGGGLHFSIAALMKDFPWLLLVSDSSNV